jgi:type I restriction enzyme S subunit
MEGAKRATTSIAAVYGKDLRPLPIALPPLAEQQQIVAEVEARTTAIDHLEAELDRQITRSNRLRQSALASAFAGNLIPNA